MNTVRKIPEFPEFRKNQGFFSGIFHFLVGTLLWVGLLIIFAFVAYTEWFRSQLNGLLQRIKPKRYDIPFWFSGICVFFFFPITLLVILVNSFLKIIKD